MKIRSIFLAGISLSCMMGMILFPNTASAVSDEEFNALKSAVQDMSQKVQTLEKTNQDYQDQIHQLKQQLGQTQTEVKEVKTFEVKGQEIPVLPSFSLDAKHNFMIEGDAEVLYAGQQGANNGFALADFSPIFLLRANDNILCEAGFDMYLNNTSAMNSFVVNGTQAGGHTTSINLTFATLDYMYNDYVTLVAGEMLLPLGAYSERGAGWLNKIPDDPLARGILPSTALGMQTRGAVPLDDLGQSLSYSVFVDNGPSSSNSSAGSGSVDLGGNVGMFNNAFVGNWHNDPSGGARVGWFYPWKPHYDVELGASGQSGEWDQTAGRNWSAAVADAAFHVSPYFELKGEYINTWYDSEFNGTTGRPLIFRTIRPQSWWLQPSFKLSAFQWDAPFVNNVELVGRYDWLNDGLGTITDRYTIGTVYYVTNTLQFKGAYEFTHGKGPAAPTVDNDFILELSYGF